MADEEYKRNKQIQYLPPDECEDVFKKFADCMTESLPEGVRMIIVLTREHDGLTVQRGNMDLDEALQVFRCCMEEMDRKLGAAADAKNKAKSH